jgi:hypothetical protein
MNLVEMQSINNMYQIYFDETWQGESIHAGTITLFEDGWSRFVPSGEPLTAYDTRWINIQLVKLNSER